MPRTKPATVYLGSRLHRALRLKSAETDQTISDLVNDAVRQALAEDADDLGAIEKRKTERRRPFDAFAADLKRRGRQSPPQQVSEFLTLYCARGHELRGTAARADRAGDRRCARSRRMREPNLLP